MALALTGRPRSVRGERTLDFYEDEAEAYREGASKSDLSALYPALLRHVPPGGRLLDAGSGSGRDTLAFLDQGYAVDAFDASAAMAAIAHRLTGVPVQVARFEEWAGPVGRYDGIWAFASLLHVRRADLPDALSRLGASLKPGGHLLASFKWGAGDAIDDRGRRYTNMTLRSARCLLDGASGLATVRIWRERGPTALGSATWWVYLLARRTPD